MDNFELEEECFYCGEPFTECETIIFKGNRKIGYIPRETDKVSYMNCYWHSGCVKDFKKDIKKELHNPDVLN